MIFQRDEKNLLDESMQVTKWWNRFNMRGSDGATALPTGGEEMGDMIAGDQKIIHHHYPPAAPAKSKLGTLAKLAIGAGLIGTGAGVMAGAPLIISALKDWKQPAAVQPNDVDTDTTGELMLWPPKAK